MEARAGEITEVRMSKAGEPWALVAHIIAGVVVVAWDAPSAEKVPPAPPAEPEARRRFPTAADLFAKAREAFGLKDFRGTEQGMRTLNLEGVEDLILRSAGPAADYDYTFFGLAREDLVEELEVEVTGAAFLVELGPGGAFVQRRTVAADGRRMTVELVIETGAWQGAEETRPGGRRELTRAEAEQFLAEALEYVRAVRSYFGIAFGRDLAPHRIP